MALNYPRSLSHSNTKYRDATVVTAMHRFLLLWHDGLKRTPVVGMALDYPRSLCHSIAPGEFASTGLRDGRGGREKRTGRYHIT